MCMFSKLMLSTGITEVVATQGVCNGMASAGSVQMGRYYLKPSHTCSSLEVADWCTSTITCVPSNCSCFLLHCVCALT